MTSLRDDMHRAAGKPAVVVIGASAGAVEALSVLLPGLPANYAIPVVVVVHLPPDRKSIIAELFATSSSVRVQEADDKEPLAPGTVYFAPPDYHVLLDPGGWLSLSSEEPVLYSRPSIDVLFESAAEAFGPQVVGIVLTGANSDGAKGLQKIIAAGGAGLVQNPAEAQSATMPQAALDRSSTALSKSLAEILSYLIALN